MLLLLKQLMLLQMLMLLLLLLMLLMLQTLLELSQTYQPGVETQPVPLGHRRRVVDFVQKAFVRQADRKLVTHLRRRHVLRQRRRPRRRGRRKFGPELDSFDQVVLVQVGPCG